MTLQRIYDSCVELATLTSDGWINSSSAELETTLERAHALKEDIRHMSNAHNSAVLRTMRKHHPDQPHIQPDKLTDPLELLQTNWELLSIPTDLNCIEPLTQEYEEKIEAAPARIAVLHRFAMIVRNQAGTLLGEAAHIHEGNRVGDHKERIPLPHGAGTSKYPVGAEKI